VPPFEGVAVNVTLVPLQIAPAGLATILTLAAPPAFTVMVIALDVAGDPVPHVTVLVSTQVIISPFARVEDVYVDVVAPVIFAAFFFHWYVGLAPPFVAVAVKVTLVPVHIDEPGFAAILTLTGTDG
jgi:hypothetical protein